MPSYPNLPPLPSPGLPPLEERSFRKRRKAPMPTITEEERQSMLGNVLGGLAYVGGAIDKPFAAMRGLVAAGGDVLSGDLGDAAEHSKELLHLIPFSGTLQPQLEAMGVPVPEDHITGREVLESFGAPKNRPGAWNAWKDHPEEALLDIGGVAAELLIAPPLLPGLMPLTKAARMGAKASKGMLKAESLIKEGKRAEGIAEMAKDIQRSAKGAEKITETAGYVPGTSMGIHGREVEEGARHLIGLRAPAWSPWRLIFGDATVGGFGAGNKTVAKALDKIYYGTGSPVPALRQAFSPTVKGLSDPLQQKAMDLAVAEAVPRYGALRGMLPAVQSEYMDLGEHFASLARQAGAAGDEFAIRDWDQFARLVADSQSTVTQGAHLTNQEIQTMLAARADIPTQIAGTGELAQRFHNLLTVTLDDTANSMYQRAIELGMKGSVMDSLFAAHFTRRGVPGLSKEAYEQMQARLFSKFGPAIGRRQVYDVPESTLTINRIVSDPLLTRGEKKLAAAELKPDLIKALEPYAPQTPVGQVPKYQPPNNIADLKRDLIYYKYLRPSFEREWARGWRPESGGGKYSWLPEYLVNGGNATEQELQERMLERLYRGVQPLVDPDGNVIAEGAESLAKELGDYANVIPHMPDGMFPQTIVQDVGTYLENITEVIRSLHVKHNFLHGVATTEFREGMVPLEDAWKSVTSKSAKGQAALTDEGMATFRREFARRNGLADDAELFVPEQTGKALQGFQDLIEPRSETRTAFGKAFDQWTALAKSYLTLPYPAFHVRNRVAGWFQNQMADVPWQKRTLRKHEKAVADYLHGKGPAPAGMEHVGPQGIMEDTRLLDIAGEEAGAASGIAEGGLKWVFTPGEHWAKAPWKVRGVDKVGDRIRTAADPQFIPMAVGQRGHKLVETMNRVPLFLEAMENGLTPAQAKALVERVQYNYGAMSPFEKTAMRRTFLFYGWMKNNAAYHVGEVLGNPGGKLATSIRMAAQTHRAHDGQLPRWLQEEMAVPVPNWAIEALGGSPEEGDSTILRRFGLPFEDLRTLQFNRPGRTAGRLIGQMNPLISTAFKLYGGTDPYSGRKIDQMEGPSHYISPAGIPLLDAMFQATPLSRAYWSGQVAADTRKPAAIRALDLATGAKLSTYDMAKLRLYDLQRAMNEQMKRNPYIWQGEHSYIPKELKEKAGPEAEEQLRKSRALAQEIKAMKLLTQIPKGE